MIELLFRFIIYAMIGVTGEMVFSVIGLKYTLGYEVKRRVAKKYAEGFVSLYMFPLYGLSILFIFEPLSLLISHWFLLFRVLFYGILFALIEFILGFLFDKIFKFYPWDFYEKSKYKILGKSYSLWTYIPVWGLYAIVIEKIILFLLELSSYIPNIINI